MANYLLIGASSGIGKQLAHQLAQAGSNVYGTYCKNETTSDHPNIKYFQLNVLDDIISLDFLPEILDGVIYCPGSIQLRPFERIKPIDFANDYKLLAALRFYNL